MKNKGILIDMLSLVTKAGAGISGLVVLYLFVMAALAIVGFLPEKLAATYEIPIYLHGAESFYPVATSNPSYSISHIEVKRAELEVLPQDRTWPQALAYMIGAFYVGLFCMILFKLSKVLDSFGSAPFQRSNVHHIRWIGLCVIVLGVFQFVLNTVAGQVFQGQFTAEHATLATAPSFQNINFVALFAGLVMLVLSSVFNTGAELQELEELTI